MTPRRLARRVERLRWRLARRLVGPFVTLPDRDGAWLVVRMGVVTMTVEAERLRLRSTMNLSRLDYGADTRPVDFQRSRPFMRFVGTVKR